MGVRNFLEIREILTEKELDDGIKPVFFRVQVSGKADAIAKKSQLFQYFADKEHKDTYHICNHPGGSCVAEDITEET